MKVLITGANGFIGKNLVVYLGERGWTDITTFVRGEPVDALTAKVAHADFIFHLAGINRPKGDTGFFEGNVDLTRALCAAVESSRRKIPLAYASSIQVDRDNAYGSSKRMAEDTLHQMTASTGSPTYIYRLPNVFGKWCRPNYNSAVATFCCNISRGLPIEIHEPNVVIDLVYIDDLVADFERLLSSPPQDSEYRHVEPRYQISVGNLVEQLRAFKAGRTSLEVGPVGNGLTRALYSTYISYYSPEQFAYPLIKHEDARGIFVEVLKTRDFGQFSYFTAHPGVTRGGHYHHSKTEKFLVLKGDALFRYRNIQTGETYEYRTDGAVPEVVETIPGWAHDITNIGQHELVVMVWANEVFDPQRPDTVAHKV